jgi:hypothetical protein
MRRMLGAVFVALISLSVGPSAASANHFGPPWQSRAVVDRTMLWSQPDRGSPPFGPLLRGQVYGQVSLRQDEQ